MNQSFNNYTDANSLDLLMQEIEKTIDNKCFIAALHMALSIPDMLGKLMYPKLDGKQKYIKWFDDNVHDITFGYLYSDNPFGKSDGSPDINGEVCYALRCKFYHEGTNHVESKTKARINEFVLVINDKEYVMGDYAGIEFEFDKWDPKTNIVPFTKYLYVSCKGLVRAIIEAAKAFINSNPNLEYPKLRINNGGGKINDDWFVK